MYDHNFLQEVLMPKYPDKTVLIIALGCFVCAVIGYLVGSVNFSIIISKVRYKDDIRDHGSGNAGTTNMLRTHGTLSGIATLIGDAAKAAVAMFIGAYIYNLPGAYVAGFFCILGHVFPLYFKFKGGKGVATVAVFIALTNIRTFIVLFIIFVVIVIGTRYISLGSVLSVLLYPLVLFNILKLYSASAYEYIGVIFAFLIAILVTVKHRSNIKRIFNHTESKLKFTKKGTETGKDDAAEK